MNSLNHKTIDITLGISAWNDKTCQPKWQKNNNNKTLNQCDQHIDLKIRSKKWIGRKKQTQPKSHSNGSDYIVKNIKCGYDIVMIYMLRLPLQLWLQMFISRLKLEYLYVRDVVLCIFIWVAIKP